MNRFRIISAVIVFAELLLLVLGNIIYFSDGNSGKDRLYRVEARRIAAELTEKECSEIDLSKYQTIVSVSLFYPDDASEHDYIVENVDGTLYRMEYREKKKHGGALFMNIAFCLMLAVTCVLLFFVGKKIILPFERMNDYAEQLSKGNLTQPMRQEKNKFFKKFLWGLDMLRESMEERKRKELELQKERKTLILSLSHDIKTPLSAIELYTRALKEDLYETEEKRKDALLGIAKNAAEIQNYMSQIVSAAREDFLKLEVHISEFYLQNVIQEIKDYYGEKLAVSHTRFEISPYADCLLAGDRDRVIEVMQNIMENAVKYGDGKYIFISCDEEEDCKLIRIANSGCSVKPDELLYLFDSFYRGSNSQNKKGSGLGLYIAKELMKKMDGDVFAEADGDIFAVTVVIRKA